jgi:hypothetical protein
MAYGIGQNNGQITHHANFLVGTNPTLVQPGPTQLNGYAISNCSGTPVYMKFYDAQAPVVQTSGIFVLPTINILIPPNTHQQLNVASGSDFGGVQFSAGLSYQTTANSADTDQSGISGPVLVNLFYR